MRRISAQIEALSGPRFILLIGLVAGAIQSAPQFFLDGITGGHLQLLPVFIMGITAVVWWSAAFLLWWVTVRRRQSTWILAAQVTLGLLVADLLHAALAAVPAAIDTHGEFAAFVLREPWTFIASNLQLSLFRAPMWLVGAIVAIAMGRNLNEVYRPHAPAPASTDFEPVN